MKLALLLAVVCLAAVSCKHARGGPEAAGGPSAVAPPPPVVADVAPAATHAEADVPVAAVPDTVPAPEAAAVADAAAATDGETAGSPAPVTLRFTIRRGVERYVGYARAWTEALVVERLEGEGWEAIAYHEPICVSPCAPDGSIPSCAFCSPPTPQPSFRAVSGLGDYDWPGTVYEASTTPDGSCSCWREVPAPHGRYRATLCSHPGFRCERPPCPRSGPREGFGFVTGDEACDAVEFDVTGEPRTVELAAVAAHPAHEAP